MKLDKEKLKEFIKFMDENNLSELEIEEQGKRIRLKRGSTGEPVIVTQGEPKASPKKDQEKTDNGLEIRSPMVGTFYRAPSPGAAPYVDIGKVVKSGDVVCIIEAMKLMNEIKAEESGKIVKICPENGEAVEFGQALFVVEPA